MCGAIRSDVGASATSSGRLSGAADPNPPPPPCETLIRDERRQSSARGDVDEVQEPEELGYEKPNVSAIERQNSTSRGMNAHLARRRLAFSRTEESREGLGWWSAVVYNFCRTQRGLRVPSSSSEDRTLPSIMRLVLMAERAHTKGIAGILSAKLDPSWHRSSAVAPPLYNDSKLEGAKEEFFGVRL
jgi:hypothetical protein